MILNEVSIVKLTIGSLTLVRKGLKPNILKKTPDKKDTKYLVQRNYGLC